MVGLTKFGLLPYPPYCSFCCLSLIKASISSSLGNPSSSSEEEGSYSWFFYCSVSTNFYFAMKMVISYRCFPLGTFFILNPQHGAFLISCQRLQPNSCSTSCSMFPAGVLACIKAKPKPRLRHLTCSRLLFSCPCKKDLTFLMRASLNALGCSEEECCWGLSEVLCSIYVYNIGKGRAGQIVGVFMIVSIGQWLVLR